MQAHIIHGTYKIHAGNYDWGCSIDKAIVSLEEAVGEIHEENLTVTERKLAADENTPNYDTYKKDYDRKVTAAYLCDEEGKKIEGPSRHFALEMYVSPEVGSPFVCTYRTQIFIWSDPYELHIKYRSSDMNLDIDPVFTERLTAADMFAKESYIAKNGTCYQYASYTPEKETDTLFVWLHGLGEGQKKGSDAYLPLLGRKGTTMAGQEFQDTIGGAYVLVPQCPTYWMDADGKESNFFDGKVWVDQKESEASQKETDADKGGIRADGTSYYTESLYELIDWYAREKNCTKIALAGCSNGGYMSLIMASAYPDLFSAVVPICESMPDDKLSDEAVARLAGVPLYFVYSKDDPIVIPETHEIPTIERLKKAGAKDLHVSTSDHVIDTSGTYRNEDGSPYTYMGHLSWIYYDNNETDDGTGLSTWEWMDAKLRDS
ncbi:MAG: hypothetical protein IJ137_02665 [Eubacterium sp.]|nr:hypothetical protein [Eubacterium sp.]